MAKHIITNLVGSSSKYDLTKVSQSYTLNMYPETVDQNDSYVNRILRPIKGYKVYQNISGKCRGLYTCSNGTSYAVFDTTLYLIKNNKVYTIGELASNSNIVHFAETGSSVFDRQTLEHGDFPSHLVLVDGVGVYSVNTSLKPAQQAADFGPIQLPTRDSEHLITISPTHIAYLYGYLVVNDAGTDSFYISYQFPFQRTKDGELDKDIFQVNSEEWGAQGGQSLTSYWQPDNTTALVANGSRLITFGEKSIQWFQYTNNLNTPFSSPDTAAQMIGLKAINSLCQLSNIIVWLGSNDIGNNGIYLNKNGSNCERVSTTSIEQRISKMNRVDDAIAQIWQDNSHIFYVITFPSENVTLCYDLIEQSWTDRCSLNERNERIAWRYQFATKTGEGKIIQACDDAIVEQTEETWLEHDSTPILRLRRGGVIHSDHSPFIMNSIQIETNNGDYEYIRPVQARMMMRFSADGCTWSDLEWVDIGSVGEYDYDCIFYNFGLAKVFTIELSCSDNVPFALYDVKIDADKCAF